MHSDIAAKLNAEFREPITTERQVVYILVELRKLLEGNGTLDQYRTLKTCCDWAVHPKLSQASAQAITKLFDEYEAKYRSQAVGVAQAEMPQLVEFCEHTRFRAQLIVACEANGIDADAISDDGWWRAFLTQYSEIVKDCPIEARANNTKYVTCVKAFAIDPASIGIFNREFGISWLWERNDIPTPGNVVSLF
jgi:hypothetical protein